MAKNSSCIYIIDKLATPIDSCNQGQITGVLSLFVFNEK